MFEKTKTIGIENPCAVHLSEINKNGYFVHLKCLTCGYTSITRETSLHHPQGDIAFTEFVKGLTCNGPNCPESNLTGALEKLAEVTDDSRADDTVERLIQDL